MVGVVLVFRTFNSHDLTMLQPQLPAGTEAVKPLEAMAATEEKIDDAMARNLPFRWPHASQPTLPT